MSILGALPQPKRSTPSFADEGAQAGGGNALAAPRAVVCTAPAYGKRKGFKPKKPEDFGDGGAYPECHVLQYPSGVGRKGTAGGAQQSASRTVALTTNADGTVEYDAILKSGSRASGSGAGGASKRIVHSTIRDLIPSQSSIAEEELVRPTSEQLESNTEKTRQALNALVGVRVAAASARAQATSTANKALSGSASTFVRYTPASGAASASGDHTRVVRMVEAAVDPLEPPKFKHKKATAGLSDSPPAPILHSPQRKLTKEDQEAWKIPPCISNWKNPKGYTVPLDKRLAADGRGLQEVQVNDNFAKFSESLYIAERQAREEVTARAQMAQKLAQKEKEAKEDALRQLAAQARLRRAGGGVDAGNGDARDTSATAGGEARGERDEPRRASAAAAASSSRADRSDDYEERAAAASSSEESEQGVADRRAAAGGGESDADRAAREERDRIRQARRREREREVRMENMGGRRAKMVRDEDRDVSEKIALGLQVAAAKKEVQYDQRLFNQDNRNASLGNEDEYNVYDKPLFRSATSHHLYKVSSSLTEKEYGTEEDLAALKAGATAKFKPAKGFSGADSGASGGRNAPVQFEKMGGISGQDEATANAKRPAAAADPYGLDQFLQDAKSQKRKRTE